MRLKKEGADVGVFVLLNQLTFHKLCGSTKEERNEVLISAFFTYLTKGINVICTVFDVNNKEWMPRMQ